MRIGAALLAAGASRRFGDADKLVQPFRGRPLGEHAAIAIPVHRFGKAWVIGANAGHPCEAAWRECGFEIILNPDAAQGMGTSVALAARHAMEAGLDALMIALADMPMVPPGHFSALAHAITAANQIAVSAAVSGAGSGAVSGAATIRMPPAIFGSHHFPMLAAATGDAGARDLLAQGRVIPCPPEWLIDIDTPETLRKNGQPGLSDPTASPKGDEF